MTLLNAFLAGFVVLGAVPVIIHLLNRRRFRIIVWAAMDFLLATMKKNQRRIQLRDLILMLLRAFAIIFLALALARPTLAPGRLILGPQGEVAAVVLLDNSLSMAYDAGPRTRFDLAKEQGVAVVEALPKGSSVALVLMNDDAVAEIPEPSHELAFVKAEIDRQKQPTDAGTDVLKGLGAAWDILKKAPAAGREIYLITDVQRNAWPPPEDPRWNELVETLQKARPPVVLHIVDAGVGGTENVSVQDLAAEDEIVATDSPVAFQAKLWNHGPQTVEGVKVELWMDERGEAPAAAGDAKGAGRMRKAAEIFVDQVETVHPVRFEVRFARGGSHRVEVRVPESTDRLAADNASFRSIDVLHRIRVLLIDGDPAADAAEEGLAGETDFLRIALSPKEFDTPDRKSLIQTDVTTVYGLSRVSLRDYDAVILANVGELPPALVEALATAVRSEGKGLVIFLGDRVSGEHYNRRLGGKARLLPGTVEEGFIENREDQKEGFGFSTDDLVHPIVSFFASREMREYLARPRFYKALPISVASVTTPKREPGATPDKPPSVDGEGRAPSASDVMGDDVGVVARFATGQPAIVERKLGRGSVVLFTSSADKEWSDFPLRPGYLMMVQRAVQHVTLGRRPRRTIAVHERILDLMSVREAELQVTVRNPRSGVREVTSELAPTKDFAQVEFADTDFAGFYELLPAGGRASYFAANSPRKESTLDAFTEAGLRARCPNLDFRWIERQDDMRRAIEKERIGREIWPLFFFFVVACLLAESILAARWAPKEPTSPAAAVDRKSPAL
ncbi:MAG: VWA domain-containing protein [Planctomycetota bacterium]